MAAVGGGGAWLHWLISSLHWVMRSHCPRCLHLTHKNNLWTRGRPQLAVGGQPLWFACNVYVLLRSAHRLLYIHIYMLGRMCNINSPCRELDIHHVAVRGGMWIADMLRCVFVCVHARLCLCLRVWTRVAIRVCVQILPSGGATTVVWKNKNPAAAGRRWAFSFGTWRFSK